jgi:cell division inhibitor SepF
MGLFSKFKELVGIEDVDEDDLEEEIRNEKEKNTKIVPEPSKPAFEPRPQVSAPSPRPQTTTAPVTSGKYTKEMKMIVIEPQGFDESPRLVDSLKAKKPVIINLENLETDVARKIFDFMSGATYALNGNVQKIANNIFVFAPENVDVAYNMNVKTAEQPIRSPWK